MQLTSLTCYLLDPYWDCLSSFLIIWQLIGFTIMCLPSIPKGPLKLPEVKLISSIVSSIMLYTKLNLFMGIWGH